ncbi:MAG: transcriptional regulator BetI [Gemmobacter sp.]|jgi:TetR/AcrR family transcriptional repressor of bet genes
MPKLGMEPIRKAALVKATIVEIGRAGSLDVTVSQIAKRAGMSSALAHHYFGSKEDIFLAAMRHILSLYGAEVRGALAASACSPEARLQAIVRASFTPGNFRREAVGAWLNFYVLAQTVPEARRLLSVYQRRLRSNLLACLRPLVGTRANAVAAGLGALIDGVYLREALKEGPPDSASAVATVMEFVASETGKRN